MPSLVRSEAEERLRRSLIEVFEVPEETAISWAALVTYPTETRLAHVAFPCHALAKHLRMPPQAIAERLMEEFRAPREFSLLRDPRSVSGYLNFTVDVSNLFSRLERSSENSIPGGQVTTPKGEKVDVEFSQPNTHKSLHVGHLRNMIYGDAVCNLPAVHLCKVSQPAGESGTGIRKRWKGLPL